MKTIYNKISNIINGMLEKVGYHFVGYKVDVIKLVDYMNQAKYNVKYNTDDIRDLKDTQQLILNDIQAIQLTIKSMREDYESLRTFHNNLSIDYRDNSASHTNLLKLKNELNARIDAEVKRVELYSEIKKSLLDTPFKDDDNNNLDDCANDVIKLVNKYHYLVNDNGVGSDNEYFIDDVKRLISKHINSTDDNNYILEEIAKVLIAYKGDLIIDDFIDDVNDVFNGFNKIYNDACDDVNAKSPINEHIKLMKKANINLTNERGENNAK